MVDVLMGNDGAFADALGFEGESLNGVMGEIAREFSIPVIAATVRHATSASRNDWGAIVYADGRFCEAPMRRDLEIYDRVGGGDAFASGLIYGFLARHGPQWAVECGAAHGALAMTTPGDASMATLDEVLRLMEGKAARIAR